MPRTSDSLSSSARSLLLGLSAPFALFAVCGFGPAPDDSLTMTVTPHAAPFASGELGGATVTGNPGDLVLLMMDTDPSDSALPVSGGIPINLGQSASFISMLRVLDSSGEISVGCVVTCTDMPEMMGVNFYAQAISFNPETKEISVSNREVIRWEDLNGDCCAPCEGKVNSLTLEYGGENAAQVHIEDKDGRLVFDDIVLPGEEFTFIGLDKNGTLTPWIEVFVDCDYQTQIHTSCSQPIGPGLVAGDFTVVAGTSSEGGPLCPVQVSPNPDLCAGGKPAVLTMTYTGEDCSASNHSQSSGKVSCSGDPEDEQSVHIVAKTHKGSVYFQGDVELGGSFAIDAAEIGRTRLRSETVVDVWNLDRTELLQVVRFHTSCSEPLAVGDQFGGVRLDGFTLE